jgi:hypothetical protein
LFQNARISLAKPRTVVANLIASAGDQPAAEGGVAAALGRDASTSKQKFLNFLFLDTMRP